VDVIDDSELRDLDPFTLVAAEVHRLEGFFATLGDPQWAEPTRCEGWTRREMVAHLAGNEVYAIACLDGRVRELLREAGAHGVNDIDSWNAWQVEQRAGRPVGEVADEWRTAAREARGRLRDLGWDGRLETRAGAYPAGLQAFHYAAEYAVHADDSGVPVADGERDLRTRWRVRFARFALREQKRPAVVTDEGGMNSVSLGDGQPAADLSDEDLVEAVHGRLDQETPLEPALKEALRALA
jgi:uncharacterized protein (TIGR03083 family)